MNIVLYKPTKALNNIGMVLLVASIIPIFIAVLSSYVNWVWVTVGLFVIATGLFLGQRVQNEKGDLEAARNNLNEINTRYGLKLDVGDAFKLTKEFPDDRADVKSKNTYIANGIGVQLARINGSYLLVRTKDGVEYTKGEGKVDEPKLVSDDEAAEHAEYVKGLYETTVEPRESIRVPTTDADRAEAANALSDAAIKDELDRTRIG